MASESVPNEVYLDEGKRTVVGRMFPKEVVRDICVSLQSRKIPCMVSKRHSILKFDKDNKRWTIEDTKVSHKLSILVLFFVHSTKVCNNNSILGLY